MGASVANWSFGSEKTRRAGLFGVLWDMLLRGFCDFGKGSFAAGSGILFHEAFFDGFVVFRLDFSHILSNWALLEGFESGFDVFFDLLIVGGALFGLARGFFRRFDNRH